MQQHIYTVRTGKILRQAIFILIFPGLQAVASMIILLSSIKNYTEAVIVVNGVMSPVSLLSLFILWKYWKYSAGKMFIITNERLTLLDLKRGTETSVLPAEIIRIVQVTTGKFNFTPWSSLGYFILTDKNQTTLIIPFFFLRLNDFWLDTLTRRVRNPGVQFIEEYYPVF